MRWLVVAGALVSLALAAAGSTVGTGEILYLLDAWDAGLAGAGVAVPGPGTVLSNPAGLAWGEGLSLGSTLGASFGQVPLTAAYLNLSRLALGGIRVAVSGDGVDYAEQGAVVALGVPLGKGFGLGLRLDGIYRTSPREGLGGALDVAFLWRGSFSFGGVLNAVWAKSPVAGETWQPSLTLGFSFPLGGGDLAGTIALSASGLGTEEASGSVGIEVRAGAFGVRLGLSGDYLATAILVGWQNFRLALAIQIQPALAASYRATFIVRLG